VTFCSNCLLLDNCVVEQTSPSGIRTLEESQLNRQGNGAAYGRLVLCADCAAISRGRSGGKFIVSDTGEAYDSHNTSSNRKFLLFKLLLTWKTGRMIPGFRLLESRTPGDKPCCA
jgi:hypothetical protein